MFQSVLRAYNNKVIELYGDKAILNNIIWKFLHIFIKWFKTFNNYYDLIYYMKLTKKLNCKKCNIDIKKRIFYFRLCELCYDKYIESVEIKNVIESDMYKKFMLETNI